MWLLYGAIIGWVTSSLTGQKEGFILNIIVGILGACTAGVLLASYLGISVINQNYFALPVILVSVGGAISLLTTFHFFLWWGGLLR
jgi:uncharacterized membrane protein YeaQ/YmgE (transglycosylase-associated protein family)